MVPPVPTTLGLAINLAVQDAIQFSCTRRLFHCLLKIITGFLPKVDSGDYLHLWYFDGFGFRVHTGLQSS